MKKILFLAASVSLLISCSSDADEPVIITDPIKEIPRKRVTEVKKDNQLLYKFTYGTEGIAEVHMYSDGVLSNITRVEYTNGLQTGRYQYTSGVLSLYEKYSYEGKYISNRKIYSVNNLNQETLIKSTDYINDPTKAHSNLIGVKQYDGSGNPTSSQDITYTDSYGSSTSNTFNASGIQTHIYTLIKDDAPAWDTVLDPFVYQHVYNTKSSIYKSVSNGALNGFTAQYTYDNHHYPITAQYQHTTGLTENYTFTWETIQ
ncbi:MAG: hypothetical protein LBE92_12205 [Chryseobacterium sp.]|uniref:hypothetical protein n=1 Tax=Chryseobacterium sp. TaxID=1871047 RepID=UPI0028398708|nr:hypothetical protein [Chryseobacterium sp.]MDR2236878.1 hypothetical protein [Chryseobacterium sp.]